MWPFKKKIYETKINTQKFNYYVKTTHEKLPIKKQKIEISFTDNSAITFYEKSSYKLDSGSFYSLIDGQYASVHDEKNIFIGDMNVEYIDSCYTIYPDLGRYSLVTGELVLHIDNEILIYNSSLISSIKIYPLEESDEFFEYERKTLVKIGE